jgi:hypothetical protein
MRIINSLSVECVILTSISVVWTMLWHFHYNPILEKGVKNGYTHKPWDIRLWDRVRGRKRPEYRGIK